MDNSNLKQIVIDALEDLKAIEIVLLDVARLTSVTDLMVICSGSSNRHVKSIAKNLVTKAKENGFRPLGVEGELDGEWILVDLGDIVVHIMQPKIRTFYNIEKLLTSLPDIDD